MFQSQRPLRWVWRRIAGEGRALQRAQRPRRPWEEQPLHPILTWGDGAVNGAHPTWSQGKAFIRCVKLKCTRDTKIHGNHIKGRTCIMCFLSLLKVSISTCFKCITVFSQNMYYFFCYWQQGAGLRLHLFTQNEDCTIDLIWPECSVPNVSWWNPSQVCSVNGLKWSHGQIHSSPVWCWPAPLPCLHSLWVLLGPCVGRFRVVAYSIHVK